MEVLVELAGGGATDAPELKDAFISIRLGKERRQGRFTGSRTVSFSSAAEKERSCQVDVFRHMGSRCIQLRGGEQEAADVEVPLGGPGGPKACWRLSLRRRGPPDPAERERRAQRRREEAEEYWARHHLDAELVDIVRQLLRDKPEDPRAFLSSTMAKRSQEEAVRPEDLECGFGAEGAPAEAKGVPAEPRPAATAAPPQPEAAAAAPEEPQEACAARRDSPVEEVMQALFAARRRPGSQGSLSSSTASSPERNGEEPPAPAAAAAPEASPAPDPSPAVATAGGAEATAAGDREGHADGPKPRFEDEEQVYPAAKALLPEPLHRGAPGAWLHAELTPPESVSAERGGHGSKPPIEAGVLGGKDPPAECFFLTEPEPSEPSTRVGASKDSELPQAAPAHPPETAGDAARGGAAAEGRASERHGAEGLRPSPMSVARRSSTSSGSKDGTVRLRVTIERAMNLRNADWLDLSDPYCILQVTGEVPRTFRTKVIIDNLHPVWQESCVVDYTFPRPLYFKVYDKDFGKRDDFLGQATLTPDLFWNHGFNGHVALRDAGKQDGKDALLFIKVHRMPNSR